MTSPSDEWELDRRSARLVIPHRERRLVLPGRQILYRIPKGAVRATDCIAAGTVSAVQQEVTQAATARVEWSATSAIPAGGCNGPAVPLGTYYGFLCSGREMSTTWAGIKTYEMVPGENSSYPLAQELVSPLPVNLVPYTARCVTPNVWYHAGRALSESTAVGPRQLLVDVATGELSWWVNTEYFAAEFSRAGVCEGVKLNVDEWRQAGGTAGRKWLRGVHTLDWVTGAMALDHSDSVDLIGVPQSPGYTNLVLHKAPTLGYYMFNILYEQLLPYYAAQYRDGFRYYWHNAGRYRIINNPVDPSYEADITTYFGGPGIHPNMTSCWTTKDYAFVLMTYAPGGDDHAAWITKRTVLLARYPIETVAQGTPLPSSDADLYIDLSDVFGWWGYWRTHPMFLETQDPDHIWVFCPPEYSIYPSPANANSARPVNLLRIDTALQVVSSWKLPFTWTSPHPLWTI